MPPLREQFFPLPRWQAFFDRYARFFSIAEIENDTILKLAFGGLLLSVFVSFSSWMYSDAITIPAYLYNTYSCWPYFQSCGEWYGLVTLPYGYSQMVLYMGFFAMMLAIAVFMYYGEWVLAHMLLAVLWLWKFLVLFVLTNQLVANFDYYDTILLFVLLFIPHKLFFLRLTLVWLYFLAGTIKIHEGWVLGTYFTTLATGLPLFGNALAPLITNVVIFMQIVGSWFLLSSRASLQRAAFIYFALFHLYSGILVGYRYPTVALVTLVILFGLSFKQLPVPLFSRRAIAGWALVAVLGIIQFIPILIIKGDQKMTLEGNTFGLYMFEANHQCASVATAYLRDGTTRVVERTSGSARNRCDPYHHWFAIRNVCLRDPSVNRIAWTFDHSVNGNPFYRIVDVPNACVLTYSAFRHNDWIKLPEENPDVVAHPLQNFYW